MIRACSGHPQDMSEIILMSDARVAAVPVEANGEPLVDVRPALLVDDRTHKDSHGAEVHLRQGVLDRLLAAQAQLPDGLRLPFVEGYRPPALQRHYFERYAAELRAAHPQWPPTASSPPPAATSPRPRSPRTARARRSTSPSPTPPAANSTWAPR